MRLTNQLSFGSIVINAVRQFEYESDIFVDNCMLGNPSDATEKAAAATCSEMIK
jgi:hypothetical protein